MPKLFDSSGPVTLDRYSRFYKISHDDLLTTEDLNLISNEIDKVHDELIESIDTLEGTKLGLEHLSKAYESISTNSKLCLDELDLAREELGYEGSIVNIINTNVTKEDLSNFTRKVFTAIKHVIERLVQLVKKFIDYINTVRDFTIQYVKSIAYITKYYSKRLSNFYNVYRIIYKPLVEEIERSK